jgi:hypothetical protein
MTLKSEFPDHPGQENTRYPYMKNEKPLEANANEFRL